MSLTLAASEPKVFHTLAIATAATGIGMGAGVTFSLVQEIFEQAMGFPVWTHELGDPDMMARVSAALYAKFPLMPTPTEARADWLAAAKKATDAYGESLALARGNEARTEGPVESLVRMTGRPEDIIVVSAKAPN